MRRELDMGIERVHFLRGSVGLAVADVRRGVDDLALQIGQRDDVVIDHAERPDTGGGKVHQRGRPRPPAPITSTEASFSAA